MKKLILLLTLITMVISSNVWAENWIENYGCYDNPDEISAKDFLIGKEIDNIYDYAPKGKNSGGESIPRGTYYIPISYWDCYGNRLVDEDYITLEDFYETIQPKIPTKYDLEQDIRINNNKTNTTKNKQSIITNIKNIIKNKLGIKKNSQKINKVNKRVNRTNRKLRRVDRKHTIWNKIQDKKINKNKKEIKKVDKKHTIWNNNQDVKIDNNSKEIVNNTNFINYVNDVHTDWNNQQDVRLGNHNSRLNNHENRLNNHEDRIEDLEETEVNVIGEVEFIRQKNYKVGVYGKYDVRHNRTPEVGLRVTIGLGKSWEQKELEKVEAKMKKLEQALEKILKRAGGKEITIEKKETEQGMTFEIDKVGTAKILKRF